MKRGIIATLLIFLFAWLCEELGIFAEEVRARYGHQQEPDEPQPHGEEEDGG